MAQDNKRIRRTTEQLVADLEARIKELKNRAARKATKANPTNRHATAAVRSIDKALASCEDATVRKALGEARSTLSAALALDGVMVSSGGTSPRGGGGRRTNEGVEEMSNTLLAHVRKHPGQRSEEIAQALQTDTTTMRLPMKKLIEAGKVKTHGQRRGMTYHLA